MPAGKLSQSEFFGSLYSEHHGWLISWLRRKLGCPHNAADLAQDTFLRLVAAREVPDLRQPRAYLATVANSLVIDQWRRQALERAYLAELAALPEAQYPSPEQLSLVVEALRAVDRLLEGLSEKARTAYLHSRLDGMTHAEIAAQLGVSESRVRQYLAAAARQCYLLRYGIAVT